MRMYVSVLSAVLLLPLAVAAAPEADSVLVETNRSLYEPGEVVEATVTNKLPETIYVEGCGAVVSERLEDEAYIPVPGEACVTEGKAVAIAQGESRVFQVKDPGKSGDVRRVSVAFGWGCSEGRALSQARCKEFSTGVSPSFRVGRRGDEGGK